MLLEDGRHILREFIVLRELRLTYTFGDGNLESTNGDASDMCCRFHRATERHDRVAFDDNGGVGLVRM